MIGSRPAEARTRRPPADLKPGGILIFSKTSDYRDEPAIEASNWK
jgi:hypothetical protein